MLSVCSVVSSSRFLSGPACAAPAIRIVRPFGVAAGETVTLEVRGTNLEGASALRFDDPRIRVEKIELARPDGNDARLGRKLTATVSLPHDLPPGPLRVRVLTPRGLSNAALVRVGRALTALKDAEPNNRLRQAQSVTLPAAVEGNIEPGDDVDLFAVELKAGETLVAEAIAARGGSGLDPLLTIFAPDGRELAWDDDTFGTDAAVSARAPISGRYVVQHQDANGRNRDNNVEQKLAREYRLEIGRVPLVTAVFPPGTRRGAPTALMLQGANLPDGSLFRFEPSADAPLGDTVLGLTTPQGASNPVTIRVGDFPAVTEAEPNHDIARIQEITVPVAIIGVLEPGEDTDLFRLKAAPGAEGDYRITAYAARLGSPADPVLTVLNDKGDPQGEDDDKLGRDARLDRAIDAREGIVLSVRDYFNRGGPRFVYRIEVEPLARRGVTLTADLGSRTLPRSASVALPLTVERRGFDGPVTVLAGDLPPGVTAVPVTLTPKSSNAFLILSTTASASLGAFPFRLVTRDAPLSVALAYREGPTEMPIPLLAVAESAPLSVALEPAELTVPSGGQAQLTITLDRRGDSPKKAVKVRLLPPDGDGDDFDPIPEITLAADAKQATATLKARPNAPARRLTFAARARFDDAPEPLGVCSVPVGIVISPPAK